MVGAVKRLLLCLAIVCVGAPARAGKTTVAEMPDSARAVVSKHARQIRRCYERGLREEPLLGGKLVVHFRVGADGRARTIQFAASESTLRHAGVETCVARVFKAMRFRRVAPSWYRSPLVFGNG
jgi:hypothetical protein